MFYNFRQNNSGGWFGKPAINVIIEAHTVEEANDKAEQVGLYFNGCDLGTDCDCCGDRWSRAWKDEGTENPEVYGQPVDECKNQFSSWATDEVPFAIVYYLFRGTRVVEREKEVNTYKKEKKD